MKAVLRLNNYGMRLMLPNQDQLKIDIDSLLSKYATGDAYKDQLIRDFMLSTVLFNWEDPEPDEILPLTEGLNEIRLAIAMFKGHKYTPKITIFGSARTEKENELYQLTFQFAKLAADYGYKIITGAGPGIMEAGNSGAGPTNSFGLALHLPFESFSKVFENHPQNMTIFKHFYSRKLTFYRESQAIVVMPGGFGTMDEIFQGLASIQTGKYNVRPFILLDKPDGTFWKEFDEWIQKNLLGDRYITGSDTCFYQLATSAHDTMTIIQKFYHHFHSYFMINDRLFLQLKIQLSPDQLHSANKIAIENGFGDLVYIRDRYYNNTTLFVYSCQKHNKHSFAIIHQLITHINGF